MPDLLSPLHEAIYSWLREQEWARPVYDAVIAPAQVERTERTFLAAERFRSVVKDTAEHVLDGEASGSKEETCENAVALFSLAFALLQPEDAPAIVASILPLGRGFESFFGVEIVNEPDEA